MLRVPGTDKGFNQELEATRVADFLELMFAKDALHRNESCGGHFREEYQTQREKRCVTMKTLLTLPLGNTKENQVMLFYTKSN
jgi:succinate dehydrogenase/fumarate reductase flavoprotein subunit